MFRFHSGRNATARAIGAAIMSEGRAAAIRQSALNSSKLGMFVRRAVLLGLSVRRRPLRVDRHGRINFAHQVDFQTTNANNFAPLRRAARQLHLDQHA